MILIKENKQKKRQTYKLDDRYRKVWSVVDLEWLTAHIELLKKVVPNYVLDYGYDSNTMWIDYRIIPGYPASDIEHTDEFVEKIYKFCLENIKETAPYVHGDWVLSNILVDGDKMFMCDWDNLGKYPKEVVMKKLHKDLKSAFGERFDKVIL